MTSQFDRMEAMLIRLTSNLPESDQYITKRDVSVMVTEMFRHMKDGRRIEAIKLFRLLTGMGLKESKDEIVQWEIVK